MATSLFAKLNNIFGNQENYGNLYSESLNKAKGLSARLFQSVTGPRSNKFETGEKVAVIGGGLAGLSASYFLLEEGARVTLFEPRRECGGRVLTDRTFIPERLVEGGAELIGLNHPLWITLARDLGLNLTTVTPELHYVAAQIDLHVDVEDEQPFTSGFAVETRLQIDVLRQLHARMDSIYSKLNELARKVDPYRPWTAVGASSLDKISVAEWLEELTLDGVSPDDLFLAKRAVRRELENDQTVPLEHQSLLGLLAAVAGGALSALVQDRPSEYWTHSEVFRCGDGNQTLAARLLEKCQDQGDFEFLSFRVNSVDRTAGFLQVSWDGAAESSRVFDWVVLAVPAPILFGPRRDNPINLNLADTLPVSTPQCGSAVKFLTHVDNRFWLHAADNSCAPSAFSGQLGSFWEATDSQTNPTASNQDAGVGISLFSGAACAETVQNRVATSQIINQIEEIFENFSRYLKNDKLVDWPEEEHIRTGYSCPGLGELTNNKDFYSRHHDHVVFAGEYTSAPFFGYMEGALQSGLRASMIITGSEVRSSPRFS